MANAMMPDYVLVRQSINRAKFSTIYKPWLWATDWDKRLTLFKTHF